MDKIGCDNVDELKKFLKRNRKIQTIINAVKDFKTILFGQKIESLSNWIKNIKKLNINDLNSFINGLERDIDAVHNSIKFKYSNGLAEGTINKIKLVKRIMFGRCSFELLKKKLMSKL